MKQYRLPTAYFRAWMVRICMLDSDGVGLSSVQGAEKEDWVDPIYHFCFIADICISSVLCESRKY